MRRRYAWVDSSSVQRDQIVGLAGVDGAQWAESDGVLFVAYEDGPLADSFELAWPAAPISISILADMPAATVEDRIACAAKRTGIIDPSESAPIDDWRRAVCLLMDAECERRIRSGFEFPPGSGLRFSLSANSQDKWNALMNLLNAGMIDFATNAPKVRTIDDLVEVTMVDGAMVLAYFGTAAGTGQAHLNACRIAKGECLAAATVGEAMAIYTDYLG